MKPHALLSAGLLALLAALSAVAEKPQVAKGLKILPGVAVRNLTIYPVLRSGPSIAPPKGGYITLDEGQSAKSVVVKEIGNVNQLQISNKSKKTLFIMAGEMVTGGKQDRIVGVNVTLAPGQSRRVPAFCVERGRWTKQGAFSSNKGLVHSKLRYVAQSSKDQSKVWREVQLCNMALATGNQTGSYRFNFSNAKVAQVLAEYLAPLRKALAGKPVVGICVAINGVVVGADIYLTLGLFDKFREKLLRSYAIDAITRLPEALQASTAPAYYDRALLYLSRGERKKALADLGRAIARAPKTAAYLRTRALVLRQDPKQIEAALNDYGQALLLEPKHDDARLGRATLFASRKAWAAAHADLTQVLARRPKDPALLLLAGWLRHKQGKLTEALAYYTRAIEARPKHGAAWYNRGLAQAVLGDRKEATADLTQARKLAPGYFRAWRQNKQRQQAQQQQKRPQAQAVMTVEQLLARITLDKQKPVEPISLPLRLSLPARARQGLAAILQDRAISVPALPVKTVQSFLAEIRAAKMKRSKNGALRLESKRYAGFGTGSDQSRLLHLNVHRK